MNPKFVFFNLQTTGTGDNETIQIGAVGSKKSDQSFSAFILPYGRISNFCTKKIHGIEKVVKKFKAHYYIIDIAIYY
jgi:DNA polymerase III epsilon subunit-like protein